MQMESAARRDPARRRLEAIAPWLLIASLSLVLGFAFQGARGLWEPDEGRYAEVAREMLVSGDIWTPRLDAEPHFTKPPLTYWLIAASLHAFGRSEWAVRLFLAVSFALTGLVVALLGARMWNRETGVKAGAIYLTSLTPFVGASFVTPDTLLVLFEALALYAFWRSVTCRSEGERWGWPLATGVALGLGFLTKGPPALVFLPGMLLWWKQERRSNGPRAIHCLPGLVAGVMIGLSWFLIVADHRPGLATFFLRDEVIGRIEGHHHRNSAWYGPFVIYGPALIGGALPWCLAWPSIGRRARALVAREGGLRRALHARPEASLLAGCLAFSLLLFCLVRSRLPLYILPLFVPMALLTARAPAIAGPWLTSLGSRQRGLRLGLWVVCLLGIRLGLAAFPTEKDARRLYRALPPLGTAELIVNDTETHHGLAFYTQRDLEYVSGLGATPESVHSIPIEVEIAEEGLPGQHPHVYLVRRSESMALERLLEKTHARVMDCGSVGALEAMRTVPVGVPHGGAGTSSAAGGGGGV